MLVDPALPDEKLSGLIDAYRPDILLSSSPIAEAEGFARGFDSASAAYWAVRQQEERGNAPIAPNLQLMLATSGTTGSARFVRLSGAAVVTNALQIADVLRIDSRSVAIAHLPLHYSYGLSLVTSHLQVGGRVFVMNDAVTSPSFWQKVAGGTHPLPRRAFPLRDPGAFRLRAGAGIGHDVHTGRRRPRHAHSRAHP